RRDPHDRADPRGGAGGDRDVARRSARTRLSPYGREHEAGAGPSAQLPNPCEPAVGRIGRYVSAGGAVERGRTWGRACLALLALTLTACGTTVPQVAQPGSPQGIAPSAGDDGLGFGGSTGGTTGSTGTGGG